MVFGTGVLALLLAALGAGAEQLSTAAEKEAFLLNARVVKAHLVSTGKTGTWRLTLDEGEIEHDASFQSIDERAPFKSFADGTMEVHFVDSYRYNIAAYRLAGLIGLGDMVPVSVERSWRAMTGAFTWWIDDVAMDENTMIERGLKPPDPVAWSQQIYCVRIFAQLVYDMDRNRSNLLITKDWKLWMIDFSRAFRRWEKLRSTEGLLRCDRELFSALGSLSEAELHDHLDDCLSSVEIQGVLSRARLLVEYFQRLIDEQGEAVVLY
jgi:hypothetical protein